jgi:hypothetical protein
MNIILLVPNVVRRYIASFPEATNNAYSYFNYDNRVVDERVERLDAKRIYQGPQDFSDVEYDGLVAFAQQKMDPTLAKYSMTVACEDALHMAIRSYNNGLFDGKINASRYTVLLGALKGKFGLVQNDVENYRHAKKEEKKVPEKDVQVRPHVLKQLGIKEKDIPHIFQLKRRIQKGVPHLVREKGKVTIKKK